MEKKKTKFKEPSLDNNTKELNKYEKKIVELYSQLWEMRGSYFIIGKVFGILVLRAFKPEYGLDQRSIAKFINRSISTASRSLSSLLKSGKCHYIEILNNNHRRERRYYVKLNLKELIMDQYKQIINETIFFKERLKDIHNDMSQKDNENYLVTAQFLKAVQINLEKLITFNEKILEMGEHV